MVAASLRVFGVDGIENEPQNELTGQKLQTEYVPFTTRSDNTGENAQNTNTEKIKSMLHAKFGKLSFSRTVGQ